MYKIDNSVCYRALYKDDEGNPVRLPKKAYKSFEEALIDVKKINIKPSQIHRVEAYKCGKCLRFHVGKTNKLIKRDKKWI